VSGTCLNIAQLSLVWVEEADGSDRTWAALSLPAPALPVHALLCLPWACSSIQLISGSDLLPLLCVCVCESDCRTSKFICHLTWVFMSGICGAGTLGRALCF
jgi:hypothetical protein